MNRTGSKKRSARAAAGGGRFIEQKRHVAGVAPSIKKLEPGAAIAVTSSEYFFPARDEELHWTAVAGVLDAGLRPPGLFVFPWQKGETFLIPEPEGWGPLHWHDVFFSSLVDGCSAAVGIPGDRFPPTAPPNPGFPEIGEWWTPDWELDGVAAAASCSKVRNA